MPGPTYGGGKAKFGKQIYKVIKQYEEKYGYKGIYFEPFCGLMGVGEHFAKDGRKIIANDINSDIIKMWKKLKNGWKPPATCNKKTYDLLKSSKKHSAERGFIGIACAYSGIFFAGFRKKAGNTNYIKVARKKLLDISKHLKNCKFSSKDYSKFKPKGKTIYCDPPYKDNKFNSEHFSNFDHEKFWKTMRKWSKNNLVIISEYTAPKDFKVIWKKNINSTYSSTTKKRVEKLFILKSF